MQNVKYYFQLLKFRLSATVVFSAAAGYLLGYKTFNLEIFLFVIIGGIFVTGSANGFNQILERNYDKLMPRTNNRPLPKGNISVKQAIWFTSLIGLLGLFLLNLINNDTGFFTGISKSCFFGFLSMLLYVFVYTPLKRYSAVSIFVGAIPGAIPFLLGWVSATDDFGLTAGLLFAIQFLWQFPHFIAIAWVMDDQYKKAGFKMMFGGEKGRVASSICFISALLMLFVSCIPYLFIIPDISLSIFSFLIIILLGFWFLYKTIVLNKKLNEQSAKDLMKSSFIYLPLLQLVYVLDKFFIA